MSLYCNIHWWWIPSLIAKLWGTDLPLVAYICGEKQCSTFLTIQNCISYFMTYHIWLYSLKIDSIPIPERSIKINHSRTLNTLNQPKALGTGFDQRNIVMNFIARLRFKDWWLMAMCVRLDVTETKANTGPILRLRVTCGLMTYFAINLCNWSYHIHCSD